MIDILDNNGNVFLSVPINDGAVCKFSLGSDDYITLPIYSSDPILFQLGYRVDITNVLDESLGGKLSKVYEVTDSQSPSFDDGVYKYELKLEAYYMKWKNKVFKYTPEDGGQEASWSLTASLDVHLSIVLRNLSALGYNFNGTAFTYDIDVSVEITAKALTYDNVSILSALGMMAEEWECDYWVTDNIIHFGRCEMGTAVDIEIGKQAVSMTRSDSEGTFATRLYAFGSTRNISSNYRPTTGDVVKTGVVEKRLMLPSGVKYVDAYRYAADGTKIYIGGEGYDSAAEMPQAEAVEEIVTFDNIYPKTECVVGVVDSYTSTVEDEDTGNVTQTFYYVTDTSGFSFDESYILEGEELGAEFESGLLNGMEFGITFRKKGTTLDGTTLTSDVYEIVANEDYGRSLPDDTLKPQPGDKFILYGWDSTKMASSGLVETAENELYEETKKYALKAVVNDGVFNVPLYSHWVYEDMSSRIFSVGQRVNLINKALFKEGRLSRVIGYEIKLDLPYDEPTYEIGESPTYSRLNELQGQVDSIIHDGSSINGGTVGSSIYVIKTNDSTAASDSNVFSALRSKTEFLSKKRADRTPYNLTSGGLLTGESGVQFGKDFIGGMVGGVGGMIDGRGVGELESLTLRSFLEVAELRYNRVSVYVGNQWRAPGGGVIETCVPDVDDDGNILLTGVVTLHLEDGEIGAVAVDDICQGIFHDTSVPANNSDSNSDDGIGNFTFSGFYTVYFRVTEVLDGMNTKFRYALRNDGVWGHFFHPAAQMNFVAYGNFTDKTRQSSRYSTLTYERFLRDVNTWNYSLANIGAQFGDLSNLSIFGKQLEGYSAYLQNIYMSGTIEQLDLNEPYRMEIDTNGDGFLAWGEDMTVTCGVFKGWTDKTSTVKTWKVTRDTGDAAEDAAWQMKEKVKNFAGVLVLSHTSEEDDLSTNDRVVSTLFTFTATGEDGTEVTTELTVG